MSEPTGTFGNGGLIDIVGPAAPPPSDWGMLAVAALLLLILVAGTLWLYRRHHAPHRRALRHLGRLQHQLQQGAIAPRSGAFELAGVLRQGLGTNGVPGHTADGGRFEQQLARARFGRDEPSADVLLSLLTEARRRLEAGSA